MPVFLRPYYLRYTLLAVVLLALVWPHMLCAGPYRTTAPAYPAPTYAPSSPLRAQQHGPQQLPTQPPADSVMAQGPQELSFGGSVQVGLLAAGVASVATIAMAATAATLALSGTIAVPVGLEVGLVLAVIGGVAFVLLLSLLIVLASTARGRRVDTAAMLLGLVLGGYFWYISIIFLLDWLFKRPEKKERILMGRKKKRAQAKTPSREELEDLK